MTALPAPLSGQNDVSSWAIYDHGAHVSSWAPAGHEDVLWMSRHAVFEPGCAVRGGVPIVFPWFGSGRTGDLTPAHGFARRSEWSLLDVTRESDVVRVRHTLTSGQATSPSFPFAYRATSEVSFGDRLDLRLTVENAGDEEFSFEEALHTYLTVGDIHAVTVRGLDGATYLDQVAPDGPVTRVQDGDVDFVGETDRIYSSGADVVVVDPALRRTLTITTSGSADIVVWNPWVDKARALADFGDDEWRTMLCIEGGNLRGSAVTLAPGQAHTLSYSVAVAALP
jgi:glucose-6-phosphate 1-epimerase